MTQPISNEAVEDELCNELYKTVTKACRFGHDKSLFIKHAKPLVQSALTKACDQIKRQHAQDLRDLSPAAEELLKDREWIPISEKLPSGTQEVLYWDGEEVGTFLPDTGLHPVQERCKRFGVTHWMELPPPPRSAIDKARKN